jgi:ribosome-binding protein aMBF1 (putative translation factor)
MLTIQIRLVCPGDGEKILLTELEKSDENPVKKNSSWHYNLKYERQLRGWSQADVAARIGSDPKTVGRWERGLTFPSPYFQQRLVDLFGKDAGVLGFIKAKNTEWFT